MFASFITIVLSVLELCELVDVLLLSRRRTALERNEIAPQSPTQESCGKPGTEPRSQETQNGPETNGTVGQEPPTGSSTQVFRLN